VWWGAGAIPTLPTHFCASHLEVLQLELEMQQDASVRACPGGCIHDLHECECLCRFTWWSETSVVMVHLKIFLCWQTSVKSCWTDF